MPKKKTEVKEPKVNTSNAVTREDLAPEAATEAPAEKPLKEAKADATYYCRRNCFIGDLKYTKGESVTATAENQADLTTMLRSGVLSEHEPD